jgi:cell pole-organizing protein PopZ
MTTTQLLPLSTSPSIHSNFERLPYACHGFNHTQQLATSSATTINNPILPRSRQVSPASVISAASAPLPYNDENVAPPIDAILSLPTPNLAHLDRPGTSNCVPQKLPSKIQIARPTTAQTAPARDRFETVDESDILRNALEDLERYRSDRGKTSPNAKSTDLVTDRTGPKTLAQVSTSVQQASSRDDDDDDEAVAELPMTPARKRATTQTSSSDVSVGPGSSPLRLRTHGSYTSSGFVHTIKTASFSNFSFGALSKRLRQGRSSESRYLFGSHSRFSTDSERPATTSSIDEHALWRGIKRRRILEELVNTEESYVADLKALVYLMSTLLASATSLPNRVRGLVQKNILDLLHLHENLVDDFHYAAYKAAARKWADTSSPRALAAPHRLRWQSLDSRAIYRPSPARRHARTSTDSDADLSRSRARLIGTDPADIADVISIFRRAMSSFFAYEEYCANHEIIAHDLQRHLPNLWSTYETGMESLARSLTALDSKSDGGKKALTVSDLLIKPIQRICKYPLLLDELLSYTPVSDDPSVHAELETLIQCLRDIMESVNSATQNPEVRLQIHRRWSLRSRLLFDRCSLAQDDFRLLGNALLCGVLHVAYQTRHGITGVYALCVLFQRHFLVAFPVATSQRFDIVAFINLDDLSVETAADGKGLQSPSAVHTWKLSFVVEGNVHEFLMSASSATEEESWKRGLRGNLSQEGGSRTLPRQFLSSLALDLRCVGAVYERQDSLARYPPVQRAATVGNRASISHVVIRNTNNPGELHEFRHPLTPSVNRSQSHMSTNRVVVLAPKRSERARLESMLRDVWTKDKLPYPGMIASRGGQIIRASAGSLARKLSLASIQGSFSRRSASLTLSTRKSYETLAESKKTRDRSPMFEIRRDSIDETPTPRPKRKPSHDVPELDSMDNVVSRMIGDSLPIHVATTTTKDDGIRRTGVLHKQPVQVTSLPVGPDDSAQAFYPEAVEKMQNNISVEESLAGKTKKRWSNPIGVLKGRAAEGFRSILYSSR